MLLKMNLSVWCFRKDKKDTAMELISGPTFSIKVSEYGNDLPTTDKASTSSSSGETANEEGGVLSRPGSGI
ncbi:unnamed protein product [Arabis nemorensis]|uniref:Uncharacterized protein n=1 Tax=Arabis nemorensis TaxID=586526 RepID=A0A565C602_9BRAS|nr:unnamed protein product [Arabis nemorensis]